MTVLLGGARSGKSDLAVKLGTAWTGDVVFVATAEALDDDMSSRIDHHRQDRPDWPTVEQPLFGAADLAELPAAPLLILDCVTLLVSNLLFADHRSVEHQPAEHQPVERHSVEQQVLLHMADLARALAERTGPSIVVSNEVGMGVHPETPLGRSYRDLLGTANRVVAEQADTVLLIMAGRAIELEKVSWPQ